MKLSDVSLSPETSIHGRYARTALLKPSDINPVNAYFTLKELFGLPNCESFDDSKTQWTYNLTVDGVLLNIYDYKLVTWSIAVYEPLSDEAIGKANSAESASVRIGDWFTTLDEALREKGEKIGNEFLELIRKTASKSAAKIKKAADEAGRFVLQNPFRLYYSDALSLLDRAEENPIGASDLLSSAFFLFIASFEGLLNLIYELYAKVDLRDSRIFDRLSREQLDIKVRLAPLYCECFSDKPIDHNNDVFRRFHSIVNLRNDFVHANFTKPMKRPIISEDGHTFVVEHESRDKSGLPKSIDALTQEDLASVKESIDGMVKLLIEGMKPRFRREFKSLLEEHYVQVIVEDGELIVVESEL